MRYDSSASSTPALPLSNEGQGLLRRRFPILRQIGEGDGMFVPMLFVIVFVIFLPFVQSAYYSFTNYNGISPDYDFVGFKNYATVLKDPSLSSSLYFTVLYSVATAGIVTLLAIPLALGLNRRFIGRNTVRAVFFFPAIPSVAILGFVWAFILSPLSNGALNALLDLVGFAAVPWLADVELAQASVILVGVWTLTGWHAILYLAYLQSIPADLYESATVDGANALQKFRYITIPMLRPAITVSTLLLLVAGMNVYALPIALTGGGPGFSTFTITQSIINQGLAQGQYGQAAALSIIFMAIIAFLISIQLYLSSNRRRGGS